MGIGIGLDGTAWGAGAAGRGLSLAAGAGMAGMPLSAGRAVWRAVWGSLVEGTQLAGMDMATGSTDRGIRGDRATGSPMASK